MVVAATLPLATLPLPSAGLSDHATETALLLSALGIGVRWLIERWRGQARLVDPRPTRFDGPAALLVASALFSLLASQYLHLSLRELRVLVIEPVLFYYLLSAVLRREDEVRRVIEAFLLSAVAVALLGVGQSIFGWHATEAEGVRRAVGLFGSPNHLGLHLGRAAPFLAAGWLWYRGWRRWAYGLGALAVGGGLVATFSLGARLGAGAALLAVGLVHVRVFPQRRRVVALSLVVAVGMLVAAAWPLSRVERFASHFSATEGTTFVRLQLWGASLAMLRDHPLLGIGLDNFLYLYQQEYLPATAASEPNLSHPHNLALHFWLQLGLAGLAGIAWLLAGFFWQAHRLFHGAKTSVARAVSLGAAASMVDFVVHGLVDNSYFLPDLAVLFWLSLAAVELLGRQHAALDDSRQAELAG